MDLPSHGFVHIIDGVLERLDHDAAYANDKNANLSPWTAVIAPSLCVCKHFDYFNSGRSLSMNH